MGDFSGIPDFWTLVIRVGARRLGITGGIVVVLLAVPAALSYVGPARRAARGAASVAGGVANAYRLLMRTPFGFVLAVVLSVLAVACQVVAVAFCYVVAAAHVWLFARTNELGSGAVDRIITTYGWRTLEPDTLKLLLPPSWFTVGFAALAALVILRSYQLAARRDRVSSTWQWCIMADGPVGGRRALGSYRPLGDRHCGSRRVVAWVRQPRIVVGQGWIRLRCLRHYVGRQRYLSRHLPGGCSGIVQCRRRMVRPYADAVTRTTEATFWAD